MTEILICLIITCSIVYIYDWTGFPREATARFFSTFCKKEIDQSRIKLPKLLECSLCMTFWTTLITLFILNWKMFPIAFVCSYLTKPILYIYNVIDLLVDKIYKKIYNLIDQI